MAEKKTVVILGGGAGGLELATSLGKKGELDVVLIDANRTHIWKPHLHEVAAGIMDSNKAEAEYLDLAKKFGFKFMRGRASGLDKEARELIIDPEENSAGRVGERRVSYGHLVVAVGSTSNDFGTPGVGEHALRLDDLGTANDFHKRLIELAEFKERSGSSDPIKIAIVGGGATGVELAAELCNAGRKLAGYGHEQMKQNPIAICVVNAAPNLLPGMSEKISKGASEILASRGIEVLNSAKVKSVQAGKVVFEKDGVAADWSCDLAVWAAGVKAPDFLRGFGLEQNRAGQLTVGKALLTSDPHVSAMGDCAAAAWVGKEGQMVPPRAQAAHQMANFLADNMLSIVEGRCDRGFEYKDFGSLVSLGSADTVGTLMGALSEKSLFVEGKIAKFMYLCLYHGHQIKIHGPAAALGLMLSKGVGKRFEPQVKLH